MKFNSQICTTREQSERLLASGLKKETADVESRCENVKDQLKEVLKRNGMYVGSSHAASILRELADEWDD